MEFFKGLASVAIFYFACWILFSAGMKKGAYDARAEMDEKLQNCQRVIIGSIYETP